MAHCWLKVLYRLAVWWGFLPSNFFPLWIMEFCQGNFWNSTDCCQLFTFIQNFYSLKHGRTVLECEAIQLHNQIWKDGVKPHLLIQPFNALSSASVKSSNILSSFVFTTAIGTGYAHLDHRLSNMPETIEHRILRSRKAKSAGASEFPFVSRPTQTLKCLWTNMPNLLSLPILKVLSLLIIVSLRTCVTMLA